MPTNDHIQHKQSGLIYGLHPSKKAIPPIIITIRGNISNNNFKVVRDLLMNLRIQGIPEFSIPLMTSLYPSKYLVKKNTVVHTRSFPSVLKCIFPIITLDRFQPQVVG